MKPFRRRNALSWLTGGNMIPVNTAYISSQNSYQSHRRCHHNICKANTSLATAASSGISRHHLPCKGKHHPPEGANGWLTSALVWLWALIAFEKNTLKFAMDNIANFLIQHLCHHTKVRKTACIFLKFVETRA